MLRFFDTVRILTSPGLVVVAVEVGSQALAIFVGVARFPPEAVLVPREDVAVRIHDWNEVEVVRVEKVGHVSVTSVVAKQLKTTIHRPYITQNSANLR